MRFVVDLQLRHISGYRHIGTQKDQDKEDEAARRKALKELLQSWMDRLQLISVLVSISSGICINVEHYVLW